MFISARYILLSFVFFASVLVLVPFSVRGSDFIVHQLSQRPQDPYRHRYLQGRRLGLGAEITPLYPGYGTHFSYIYVGNPPQRQSVIVDTGSHFTAFPCAGCNECGDHTDKYWDIKKSVTAKRQKCGSGDCLFSQSYSEGSSWKAYKVTDTVYVGGIDYEMIPEAKKYSVNFTFGCQSSVTGLFRQQLADGIMGMSVGTDTLINQLYQQKITSNRIFALCFRTGGGIMTIGGYDKNIHIDKKEPMYTSIRSNMGWYTVTIEDVLMRNPQNEEKLSIGENPSVFNNGKGVIVDSGTTDTYLPSAISSKFSNLFKKITGVSYGNEMKLTKSQKEKIPDIIFILKNKEDDHKIIELIMPASHYMDDLSNSKYAFRIYLTEASGGVLGANVMNGYNIIFDQDNQQVGFAESDCRYNDYIPSLPPSYDPIIDNNNEPCIPAIVPADPCTASCTQDEQQIISLNSTMNSDRLYYGSGIQEYHDRCDKLDRRTSRPCHEPCLDGGVVRVVDVRCPFSEEPWSECSKDCMQSRNIRRYDLFTKSCTKSPIRKSCYTDGCKVNVGDYLIIVHLNTKFRPKKWSYIYTEDFFRAFSTVLNVSTILYVIVSVVTSIMHISRLHVRTYK